MNDTVKFADPENPFHIRISDMTYRNQVIASAVVGGPYYVS